MASPHFKHCMRVRVAFRPRLGSALDAKMHTGSSSIPRCSLIPLLRHGFELRARVDGRAFDGFTFGCVSLIIISRWFPLLFYFLIYSNEHWSYFTTIYFSLDGIESFASLSFDYFGISLRFSFHFSPSLITRSACFKQLAFFSILNAAFTLILYTRRFIIFQGMFTAWGLITAATTKLWEIHKAVKFTNRKEECEREMHLATAS